MDPNTLLQQIEEYTGYDRSEACRDLRDWLSKGGFEPAWTAHPEGTRIYRRWLRNKDKFSDLHR
jgi:hypothetical protein